MIHGGFSDLLVRSGCLRQAIVARDLRASRRAGPISCNRFQNQRGTYAVEFALVFPLFFLIVYSALTYGLIFTAQQSLNYAAESGARAALSWQPGPSAASALTQRADFARQTAEDAAHWVDLAGGGNSLAIGVCQGNDTAGGSSALLAQKNGFTDCGPYTKGAGPYDISVVLRYPYDTAPLVPMLGGSLMGFAVPDTLTAVAQVNLQIAYGASAEG